MPTQPYPDSDASLALDERERDALLRAVRAEFEDLSEQLVLDARSNRFTRMDELLDRHVRAAALAKDLGADDDEPRSEYVIHGQAGRITKTLTDYRDRADVLLSDTAAELAGSALTGDAGSDEEHRARHRLFDDADVELDLRAICSRLLDRLKDERSP